jgi:Ion transport protein
MTSLTHCSKRTQTFTIYALGDTLRSKFRSFARAVNDIESFSDDFFLVFMFIYLLDVFVRWFGLGWRSFRANGWNLFDLIVASGSFITTLTVRFGNMGYASQQLQKLFLVSIAFKLVQRTNSLNMLFKTAVYVFFFLEKGLKLTGSTVRVYLSF